MDIVKEIKRLPELSVLELQEMWVQYFGSKHISQSKEFYVTRLAYRLQELKFGGLNTNTQNLLKQMQKESSHTENRKDLPPVGTRLIKEYHGVEYCVTMLRDGFELNGMNYKTLSGVATKITGQKISGKRFFGLE